LKENDCFDVLRRILIKICGASGYSNIKVIANYLPQNYGPKLKNLLYSKNITLADGTEAVRKVYRIKTLTDGANQPQMRADL
jgi:hypothetical protein